MAEIPNTSKTITATIFDLDSFSEVKLVKELTFTPVTNQAEALSRVGNDAAKFLELVNEGLRAEARRIQREDPSGFHTVDEDGVIDGPFEGTMADRDAVNKLTLVLAKTVFGYSKDLDIAAKNAAKESAMDMIRNTPVIRDGLKKSAALSAE